MRTAPILAGALLIATAIAQDPAAPKPPTKATAEARMQELQEAQKQCIADWRKAIQDAQEAAKNPQPGQVMPAMPMRPDFSPLVGNAKEFAAEFAGTDDAVQFLVFVLQNSNQQEEKRAAFDTLLGTHLDSKGLAQLGGMFQYLDRIVDAEYAAPALEKLLKSANPAVRGWALFTKHKADIETADQSGEQYATAKKELQKAAEEAKDERLAKEIRSAIDLREKLGVGNVAPDIAGIDLDGVAFKLSDYKGKVVFLDFWGDW